MSRWLILLCIAALACTPKLNGTCTSIADCHLGESCSSAGLCLRPGAANGDGDAGDPSAAGNAADAGGAGLPDGGDAGLVTSAAIDILSPAASAIERGTFHVAAQTSSAIAIQDVTFYLTNASSGGALGQLVVNAQTANHWSGDLTLNASSFGEGADLVAVMHRTGLTDVTSIRVNILIDQNAPAISPTWNASQWWALDAGLSLTSTATDDRSGVASATLILPDGGTIAGNLNINTVTFQLQASVVGVRGAALHVPVGLAATDRAGNTPLFAAASTIAVDDQPPSITLVALDATVWRNGPIDVNANLSDGTGSGLASSSLLLNGAFIPGMPDGGGGYNFHANLSALPATEGAVTLQVIGADVVGNQADAGFSLNVDNVPPVISSVSIDTAPDVTDLNGKSWFRGPTVASGGTDIIVSAVVSDTYLSSSPAPSATAAGSSHPGNFAAGRWHFPIPRSAGLGASGAVAVTFDAQDKAGNHPTSSPPLGINFDDKKAFALSISSDSVVRGPSQQATISVQTAPPSGFPLKSGAVDLAAAARLTLGSCTGASSIAADATSLIVAPPSDSTLVFKVPIGTCAPGNIDGAVALSVAVNSLVGGGGSGTANTQVDSRGPVIGGISISYPPAVRGPLGWSHNGSQFNRTDLPTFAFSAYDCHGLAAAPARMIVPGFGGVVFAQAVDSRGILDPASTCASPTGITVQRFTASFNLSLVPTSSLPGADNAVSFPFTVSDGFGNQSSSSIPMNVTRRLWRTTPPAAISSLSLGPKLFGAGPRIAMYSFDPGNGNLGSWATPADVPVIAPNAGTPAIIYASGSGLTAGNAALSTTASLGSCAHGDTLSGFSLLDASTALYSSQSDTFTCIRGCNDCGAVPCSSCPSCQIVTTHFYNDLLQLSGATVSCQTSSNGPGNDCAGSPAGPASLSNRVSSSNPTRYVGLDSSGAWILADASGNTIGSVGSPAGAAPGWPIIDGSSPPLVYLPGFAGTPGRVEPHVVSSTSYTAAAPFTLPDLPASITDMQLAKNGILYVLSNNTVHAVITDSVGGATAAGGTQAAAWPSQCRDPCRSSNSGIQCPY